MIEKFKDNIAFSHGLIQQLTLSQFLNSAFLGILRQKSSWMASSFISNKKESQNYQEKNKSLCIGFM